LPLAVPQQSRCRRDRYLGLDIYRLGETSQHIGTQARGAYWLTFLGLPLLGRLGGLEVLRRRLPFPNVSVETLPWFSFLGDDLEDTRRWIRRFCR
jgi:hypothetical protein